MVACLCRINGLSKCVCVCVCVTPDACPQEKSSWCVYNHIHMFVYILIHIYDDMYIYRYIMICIYTYIYHYIHRERVARASRVRAQGKENTFYSKRTHSIIHRERVARGSRVRAQGTTSSQSAGGGHATGPFTYVYVCVYIYVCIYIDR